MKRTIKIDTNGQPQRLRELRIMGKKMNVKSPTSRSKSELLLEIGKNTHNNRTTIIGNIWGDASESCLSGATSLENLNKIIRLKISDEIKSGNIEVGFEEFKQENESSSNGEYVAIDTKQFSRTKLSTSVTPYKIINDKNKAVVPSVSDLKQHLGYIDIEDGEWVIKYLGYDKSMPVLEEQIKTYKFARYDNITFTAFYSETLGKNFLLDVISLNGLNYVQNENVCPFEQLLTKPPQEAHDFSKHSGLFVNVLTKLTPILEGSRVLISGEDNDAKTKIMQELSADFSKNGVVTFPIYLDCLNEEEYFVTKTNPNVMFASLSDTPEQKMEKVLLAYFRAQRYVERGQKVAILINDFDAIYDIIESLITIENQNYITSIATKFFNLGGRRDNDGALTIVTFASEKNLRLFERLKRSASLLVPLRNGETVYPAIDVTKVENKLESFYMDEDAKMIANDIREVVASKEFSNFEPIIKTLATLKGADRKTILNLIKNL